MHKRCSYKLPKDGYAKLVTGVDTSHNSGWCVAGFFLKSHNGIAEGDIEENGLVLVVEREGVKSHRAWLYRQNENVASFYPLHWTDIAYALTQRGVPACTVYATGRKGGRRRKLTDKDGEGTTTVTSTSEVVELSVEEEILRDALADLSTDRFIAVFDAARSMRGDTA